jgi:N utilization substance protein A
MVVPDDQLSLAIGRRGQNVRLASILTGWDIDILTEAEESERRQEEFHALSQIFMDALDVDDVIAHLLVTEGFSTVEEVAFVPEENLVEIEGFDESIIEELRERARNYLKERDEKLNQKRNELGISDELLKMPHITLESLVTLGETGVKSLDDLADLASDELREILGVTKLNEEQANETIMAARAHWFDDDLTEEADQEEAEQEGEAGNDSIETAAEDAAGNTDEDTAESAVTETAEIAKDAEEKDAD